MVVYEKNSFKGQSELSVQNTTKYVSIFKIIFENLPPDKI